MTITVDDSAFRQYLAQLGERLDNLQPVMASIGQELEGRISARFETETDPAGRPWAPWAESTRKNYPRTGSKSAAHMGGAAHGRILDRYGDMLGSLNWQADATSVRVGFGQPYAAYHEWGTTRMPRRGLLVANPDTGQLASDDEHAVLDILAAWLTPPA